MKLANWSLAILLVSPLTIASAQPQAATQSDQQQDSVAAAARRAREQKKDQPKAAKVFDNDSIPTTPGAVSVVGSPSEAPSAEQPAQGQNQTTGTQGQAKPPAAMSPAELDAAKQQIQSLKTDLDILQRKLTLDQQSYYGKPNYESDKEGAAGLNAEQTEINAKQQEIDDLQKKIDAAGGSSSNEQK